MRADLYLRLALALCACPTAAALARTPSIFINDVRVDGLRGQTLTGVDVVFDENGDIHITAKGYKVQVEGAAPATPAATANQHLWIVMQQPAGRTGYAQWSVDVYVNRVFVHRF